MRKLLSALLVCLAGTVSAQIPTPIERFTYNYINPGLPDFSNASLVYNNTLNLDATAGTLVVDPLTFQPLATSIVIHGIDTTTVAPTTVPDGTASTAVTVISPGGSGQGWGFDYNIVASPTAGQSFLTTGVSGGRNTLTFTGGGTGLLSDHGRFLSTVVLMGDWSDLASHSAPTHSVGYSVLSDFVFSGGATRYIVETTDYQTGVNPNIAFTLFGSAAAVPEPSTWALLLAGGAFLAGAVRRRRG